MTLYGIDISHHQAGINLQAVKNEGFSFVLARIGQGKGGPYGTVRDTQWGRHRDTAREAKLKLCAYWYIGNGITASENARLCASWIGDKSIPVALDCENGSGNIAFYRAVLDEFNKAGLRVPLSYIPRWYWNGVSSPDLTNLPPLWSSRYVNGGGSASQLYPGDNSSYWNGYGNNNIAIAQFTNSARVAGYVVDANAYRGSEQDLDTLLFGKQQDPIPVPPQPPISEPNMQLTDVVGTNPDGSTYTVRDVLAKQYSAPVGRVQELLTEIQQSMHLLPEANRLALEDKFKNVMELLYLIKGQPSWDSQGAWSNVVGKKWANL